MQGFGPADSAAGQLDKWNNQPLPYMQATGRTIPANRLAAREAEP